MFMQTQTKSKVLFLVTALYMKKLIFELRVNSATFWGEFGQLVIFYNRPSCVGLCFKWMQY